MIKVESSPVVIDGRQAFTDALRATLLSLAEQPPLAGELWLIDQEFAAWPLDEPAVLAALTMWLRRPGTRLRLIGNDYDAVARRCPRFSQWRRHQVHVFEAWQPAPSERRVLSAVLLAGKRSIELLDAERWRARHVTEPAALRGLLEHAAVLLQCCEPAWPATTLGL